MTRSEPLREKGRSVNSAFATREHQGLREFLASRRERSSLPKLLTDWWRELASRGCTPHRLGRRFVNPHDSVCTSVDR